MEDYRFINIPGQDARDREIPKEPMPEISEAGMAHPASSPIRDSGFPAIFRGLSENRQLLVISKGTESLPPDEDMVRAAVVHVFPGPVSGGGSSFETRDRAQG